MHLQVILVLFIVWTLIIVENSVPNYFNTLSELCLLFDIRCYSVLFIYHSPTKQFILVFNIKANSSNNFLAYELEVRWINTDVGVPCTGTLEHMGYVVIAGRGKRKNLQTDI